MKKAKSFWANPWTVSIGSTLIGLLITVIFDLITAEKMFSTIKIIFSLAWKGIIIFLNFKLKVWHILAGIVALVFVLFLLIKYSERKQPAHVESDFLQYTKDNVLGYRWEWEWERDFTGEYFIANLHPICTVCETPLVCNDDYWLKGYMKCLRCNKMYNNSIPDENHVKVLIFDNARRRRFQEKTS